MEDRWKSFIGQLPVPYVHGMTAGELARMANAYGWVQPRCQFTRHPDEGVEPADVLGRYRAALGEAVAEYPVREHRPCITSRRG